MKKNLLIITLFILAIVGNSYAQDEVDLTNGLVFYMNCNDGSSIELVNDLEGVINGDVMSEVGFNDSEDGALVFIDGSCIDFVDEEIVGLPVGGEDRTLALWMYTATTTGSDLISYGTQERGEHQHFAYNPDNSNGSNLRAGFWYKDYDALVDLSDETWHHIVMTASQDDDEFFIYIDGEMIEDLVPSTDATILEMNTTPFGLLRIAKRVAVSVNAANRGFAGMLDEIRIYNRILDEDEVVALMDFNPDAEPVNTTGISTNMFNVYPTITNDVINIKSNLDISKVEVINVAGKVVTVSANANQINVEAIAKGVYFVKAYANNQTYTAKFIKQ